MKILYIANYQGPELIHKRNIKKNRSLAGSAKIQAIATALKELGHEITICSTGVSAQRSATLFRAFEEQLPTSNSHIPVIYSSCWDLPVFNFYTAAISLLRNVIRQLKNIRYDVAIVYNCNLDTILAAWYCQMVKKIPVVLEYEDSVIVRRSKKTSILKKANIIKLSLMQRMSKAVIACNWELTQSLKHKNKLVLPGVIRQKLIDKAVNRKIQKNIRQNTKLIYCGNLDPSKGVELFLDAIELIDSPLEVHICGKGPNESIVARKCSESKHDVIFHGVVSEEKIFELLTNVDIAVNPHRTSWQKGAFWPFKVIEYLVSCGIVISSDVSTVNTELKKRLIIYDEDTPHSLAHKIKQVIQNWSLHASQAHDNINWTVQSYGPNQIGKEIEAFLKKCMK
jgi:glycosyltransferase involved in cell wall biosynthesis